MPCRTQQLMSAASPPPSPQATLTRSARRWQRHMLVHRKEATRRQLLGHNPPNTASAAPHTPKPVPAASQQRPQPAPDQAPAPHPSPQRADSSPAPMQQPAAEAQHTRFSAEPEPESLGPQLADEAGTGPADELAPREPSMSTDSSAADALPEGPVVQAPPWPPAAPSR